MTIVRQLERRVEPIAGGGARVQSASPNMNIESRFIGQLGGAISDIARTGLEVQRAEEVQAAKIEAKRQKLLLKQQDDLDKAMATKAYNDYLMTTVEHDNVLKQRVGFQARNVSNDMSTQIEPEYKRIAQALDNDNQRYLFESQVASHAITRKNQWNNYERAEISKATVEDSKAIISNTVLFAVDNYQDQNALKNARKDIDIYTEQALPGAGAEQKKAFKDSAISDIHVGRINAYLADNNVEGAIGYYNGVQDEILPDERIKLKDNLDRNDTLEKAQKSVDEIVFTTDDPVERLKQARTIKDPDVRKEAESMVKVRNEEDTRIREEQNQQFMDGKINEILNSSSKVQAYSVANSAQNGKDRLELIKIADNRFKEPPKETDYNVLIKARKDINSGIVKSRTELLKYSGSLTKSDMNDLFDFFDKGGSVGDISYSKIKEIFYDKTKNKAEEEPELFNKVYDYTANHIKSTGNTPTPNELRKIMSNALVEGEVVKGGGFWSVDPNLSYVDAVRQGKVSLWLPEVTSDEENIIKNEIKQANKELLKLGIDLIPINEIQIRKWKKYNPNWMGLKR